MSVPLRTYPLNGTAFTPFLNVTDIKKITFVYGFPYATHDYLVPALDKVGSVPEQGGVSTDGGLVHDAANPVHHEHNVRDV